VEPVLRCVGSSEPRGIAEADRRKPVAAENHKHAFTTLRRAVAGERRGYAAADRRAYASTTTRLVGPSWIPFAVETTLGYRVKS